MTSTKFVEGDIVMGSSPAGRCESSGCFRATQADDGTVQITGGIASQWLGVAVDSVEAWREFRDQVKAGAWDHIGEQS